MKKKTKTLWAIILSSTTITATVIFVNTIANSNLIFAEDVYQDYSIHCDAGPFTQEEEKAGWLNDNALEMGFEYTDRMAMVTSLGNKLAFNSLGFKNGNIDNFFMRFTTWDDDGYRQGYIYNQTTSPLHSLTTISLGAHLTNIQSRHSVTKYEAVNIGTDEIPIIGEWTAANLVDSTETAVSSIVL